MNRYDLLKQIVEQVESYEKERNPSDALSLNDFTQWLNVKMQASTTKFKRAADPILFEGDKILAREDEELGSLVSLLYRYVKIYAKRAMENSPLNNVDDFSYLVFPLAYGALSKTDLITRNAHEKTTGMEIIKRLTKLGFLTQSAAPNDGRSQLVSITEAGRHVLIPLLTEMRKVSIIAKGNLTDDELTTLIGLLKKLDTFHSTILNTEKTVDLDLVLEKYLA
jgi:MarR family transcriptional regulator, lower aerobic nicotinate degradation pathway regulator